MIVTLQTERVRTPEQVRAFVEATAADPYRKRGRRTAGDPSGSAAWRGPAGGAN